MESPDTHGTEHQDAYPDGEDAEVFVISRSVHGKAANQRPRAELKSDAAVGSRQQDIYHDWLMVRSARQL